MYFLNNSFKIINVLTPSRSVSQIPVDTRIEAIDPQELSDLALPPSKLVLLEEQKFDQLFHQMLVIKTSHPNPCFYEIYNGFLCH